MRLSEYRVGSRQMCFWLAWDRGTMNVRDLAIKFTSYAHYIASRKWAREHMKLPVLVCVVPEIAQERLCAKECWPLLCGRFNRSRSLASEAFAHSLSRIGVVVDDGGTVERAGAIGTHLVAE